MPKKTASKKAMKGKTVSKTAKKAPVRTKAGIVKAEPRSETRAGAAQAGVAKAEKPKPVKAAPAQGPNPIGLRSQHVDFLTYKVEQVRKFYGEALGFPTEQTDSGLNYLTVRITPTSSIGFMPPHPQMIGDQPPPREATLYFIVEDVDKAVATLAGRGIAFNGRPQEMPWGHRVVWTTDPEGRTVMLGSESTRK